MIDGWIIESGNFQDGRGNFDNFWIEKKLISFFINKWDFQLAKSLLEV